MPVQLTRCDGYSCLCFLPHSTLLPFSVFELQQLIEGHQEPYLLHWDQSRNEVQVVLSQMAGTETILRAATHGLVLGALQENGPLPAELEKLRNQVRAGLEKESWVIVKETHQVLDKLFPKFLKGNILQTPGHLIPSLQGPCLRLSPPLHLRGGRSGFSLSLSLGLSFLVCKIERLGWPLRLYQC
uniref:Root UVB sensitive protein C-terminal domain-containing protein n=1 Tax=Rousettus aegyptiacus TaxID=9407 RepID=A0A7J8EWV6_ROUAE|nr:hypothetical protein HJG63_001706 [Rousettus aegyptiacus]